MSQSFGPAAARLAGVAARLLGWRPDDFWRATPAELAAALGGGEGPAETTIETDELDALLARFPDGED